jgi:ribonuclease HI
LHLSEQRRLQTDGRRRHLFDIEPLRALPTSEECSSSPLIHFTEGSARVAHDLWSGWDSSATPLQDALHIYTDGSFDPVSATSAWSVVLGDQWLDSNFTTVPSDEKLLQPAHVCGATLIGASITCTQGVYPAELQAIARTLAMFPLSFNVHIHSDSEASIAATNSFDVQQNERRRLRMPARTILQLLHHLMTQRRAAGGSVGWSHVRAHTDNMDEHSVGNRMADY